MTNTVIIIGAKSDIAKAAAIQFAKNDFDLLLVGRDVTSELNQFGQSITEEYGQEVILHNLDIIDKQATNLFLNGVKIIPNGVVSFVGLLGEHQKAINDSGYAETIFKSKLLFDDLRKQTRGTKVFGESVDNSNLIAFNKELGKYLV